MILIRNRRWRARCTCLVAAGVALASLTAASGVQGCAGKKVTVQPGGDNSPRNQVFSGRVVDQGGTPIPKARVEVNGTEQLTSADGEFRFAVATQNRYIFNISHPRYADLSYVARTAIRDQTWRLVRAQVTNVDPAVGFTLTDERPELAHTGLGGASITVGPDSLVDARGHKPVGQVRAAIATLDVSRGEGPADWAVRSDSGEDGFLVSYGAVFVHFTDSTGGSVYQLRQGKAANLTLPVVPSMRPHAPASPGAKFWYYDATDGYWKGTGVCTLNAAKTAYVGKVDHLSTLNTDIAKFGNAACLKINVDPSIAAGSRLRIRYHSGGTPFGQTPIIVMNDAINAAYRLPADTNVLLELLNASDEVQGNLVVEDPIGSALVNTVLNTGAAIPSGHTLWPPPPFTDCKPTRLTLGSPDVEIRINELSTDPAVSKDDPTDDYVTWAPTFCRARLSSPAVTPVNVVLTNDPAGAIALGGDVAFAAFVSPWPVNTTATASSLSLTLPADGSWVSFVIAGKFLSPSTNDKDAIVEAHLNSSGGAVVGRKALMVRVRKNANNLQPSERSRFLFAMRKFRNQVGANFVRFQEMHRLGSTAGNEAHQQPAFLSWHRAMMLEVERELQKIDPSVALHYWNWDQTSPNLFSEDFIGASDTSVGPFGTAEPIFAATNPLNGWNTDLPFSGGELQRSGSDHTAFPGAMRPLDDLVAPDLLVWDDYGPTSTPFDGSIECFSDACEEESHNPAHGWPCAGGHVTNPVRSAADPLFYLLHSQIDRQWAYWQWKKNRYGVIVGSTLTFPAPAHYDNNGDFTSSSAWQKGSFLDDGLWPWDGTNGGTGRAQRPPNQATGPGQNVPLSTPIIPTTAFPASPRRNVWPATATIPTNAHMIDFFGKFRPQDGLGFCYDDVPY